MINLLPPEIKKEILQERKKRVILASWTLLLLFLVLFLSAMFVIKYCLQIQTAYMKAQLADNKQILERNTNEESINKINSFNIYFEKLNVFYRQRVHISEVLEKISQILPDNIYLTDFSVSPDVALENENDGLNQLIGFKISIAGFSPTRDEVMQLKENMEKEKSFKEVFFPLTNWVKSKDVSFSLSFKIAKP